MIFFCELQTQRKALNVKASRTLINRRISRSLMQVNHLELPSGEKNFNIVLGVMNVVRHEFQRIQNVFKFLMLGVILQLCRNLVYFYSFSSVGLLLTMRPNRIKPVFRKGDANNSPSFRRNIVC